MRKTIVSCVIMLVVLVAWYTWTSSGGPPGTGKNSTSAISDAADNWFEEWQNRKKYSELNPEILASIPDDKLEQALFDYIVLVIGDDYEREYEIITGLSDGFQMFYTTWIVDGEVNNGGFNQYFWNTSGEFAEAAVRGFQLIGASEHAKLMEQAIAVYRKGQPENKRFRKDGTLDAFRESYQQTDLGDVDDAYYELQEDLSALRIRYIREHAVEFTS